MASSQSMLCKFCLKGEGKYTCPRCNSKYCSTDCYKSQQHGECSESFFRDCFMEGLKDMRETQEGKKKIEQILKRMQTEQEEDTEPDSDVQHLAERLEGLDFEHDSDAVWSKLTASEKGDFLAMIKDGRMASLIRQWQPWWKCHAKVVEVDDKQMQNVNVPPLLEGIRDIGELLKSKEPAKDIRHNVVNILFGYTYLCRFYNGEILENVTDFVKDLHQVCGSFHAKVYQSSSEAVQACLTSVQENASLVVSPSFTLVIIRDIVDILSGLVANSLEYVLAALSDIHKAVDCAQQQLSEHAPDVRARGRTELKRNKQMLFATKKKLEFLFSWVVKYGLELKACIVELECLFCEKSSDLKTQQIAEEVVSQLREQKGRTPQKKKLIEELN